MFGEWKAELEACVQNVAWLRLVFHQLDSAPYQYVRDCGAGALVAKGHIKN